MASVTHRRRQGTTRILTRAIRSNSAETVEQNAQDPLAYRLLHPVGFAMPSQTIHFGEELYQFIIQSKGEEQSTSDRVRELTEAGREVEEHNERDSA